MLFCLSVSACTQTLTAIINIFVLRDGGDPKHCSQTLSYLSHLVKLSLLNIWKVYIAISGLQRQCDFSSDFSAPLEVIQCLSECIEAIDNNSLNVDKFNAHFTWEDLCLNVHLCLHTTLLLKTAVSPESNPSHGGPLDPRLRRACDY